MIISASYRTDIPSFYSEWFHKRLIDGYCNVKNPYNGKISKIILNNKSIDGFVFWTKNIGPFLEKLKIVNELEIPFMIQYTVNNYPNEIEKFVPHYLDSIQNIKKISSEYSKETVVCRYDPIIITKELDSRWHLNNFTLIAKELEGYVNEVVVSFLQFYKKTLNNLAFYKELKYIDENMNFLDLSTIEKKKILLGLNSIAKKFNIKLSVCSQSDLLSNSVSAARCVDVKRLSQISGYPIIAKRKGRRTDCLCYESRDIGAYNTCLNNCVYCYGTNYSHASLFLQKNIKHDPNSEILIC